MRWNPEKGAIRINEGTRGYGTRLTWKESRAIPTPFIGVVRRDLSTPMGHLVSVRSTCHASAPSRYFCCLRRSRPAKNKPGGKAVRRLLLPSESMCFLSYRLAILETCVRRSPGRPRSLPGSREKDLISTRRDRQRGLLQGKIDKHLLCRWII